jgi:hypothetical protein
MSAVRIEEGTHMIRLRRTLVAGLVAGSLFVGVLGSASAGGIGGGNYDPLNPPVIPPEWMNPIPPPEMWNPIPTLPTVGDDAGYFTPGHK